MSRYNEKISEAAKLGKKIDFWEWVSNKAEKVKAHATKKIDGYYRKQTAIMFEVVSDKSKTTKV